jgi:hypothetical protein
MPEIMLSSVVLPLPDGPTMNSISPKWATKSTPLTAVIRASPSPKLFVRPAAAIASNSGVLGLTEVMMDSARLSRFAERAELAARERTLSIFRSGDPSQSSRAVEQRGLFSQVEGIRARAARRNGETRT